MNYTKTDQKGLTNTWAVRAPIGQPPRRSDCSRSDAMALLSMMKLDTAMSEIPAIRAIVGGGKLGAQRGDGG